MPNEFEKIVQQKMDELQLVPSEPVWQKVEMQIRKKNDRRRVIFWILFLGLLLGGGLWMGIDHYSNNIAYHKSNNKSQEQNQITSSTDKQTTTQSITTNEKANKTSVAKNIRENKKEDADKVAISKPGNKNDVELNNKVHHKLNKEVKTKNDLIHQAPVYEQPSKKIKAHKEKSVVSEETLRVKNDDTVLTQTEVSEIITAHQPLKKIDQLIPSFDIIRGTSSTGAFPIDKVPTNPIVFNPDSLKSDTILVKRAEMKKYVESKWKYNLVATSGLSGLSNLNFFDVFGGQKSLDALYQNSPGTATSPGITYYGPSSVRKGLSFSFGAAMQKQLSRRLQFLIGLQYNYYSNSISVGSRIIRDTTFRAYSVSQYYQNNAARYSMDSDLYRNRYHFISLPLTINWQVSKKLPLNFYVGFSIQQMIQTDALVFDYSAQAYYHNNKAFNKTLVFTEYGLNYSIPLSKRYLTVGPEFHYGLSSLEKNNPDHHLFSYGLKAQLQLNKK